MGTSAVTHTARPSRRGAASRGEPFTYLGGLCCHHGCHGRGHYLADLVWLTTIFVDNQLIIAAKTNPMGVSPANHRSGCRYCFLVNGWLERRIAGGPGHTTLQQARASLASVCQDEAATLGGPPVSCVLCPATIQHLTFADILTSHQDLLWFLFK